MKSRPTTDGQFDADQFIGEASTQQADAVPTPTREPSTSRPGPKPTTKGKVPATGFVRTTFDLPEQLATRLRVYSARTRKPMTKIAQDSLQEFLNRHNA